MNRATVARAHIERIYWAAVRAVNPEQAVRSHLAISGSTLSLISGRDPAAAYDLDRYKRIFVVGAGKAAAPMAHAVEELFGERISGGCICVKYGYTAPLRKIEIIEAGHPVPDENGVAAAKKILSILDDADKNDLVISLISGGGSALLCMPAEGITLEDKKKITELLLKSGATIGEMNSVRKHLSLVKGGIAARAAFPSTVINCIISDVVGDSLDVIASGPFVPDTTTFGDAMNVLEKYRVTASIPGPVMDYLRKGISGEHDENPGEDDEVFARVRNVIIASNSIALSAAQSEAESLGYRTQIFSSAIVGEASAAAAAYASKALEIEKMVNERREPQCIIGGGETTVNVHGNGIGGRNMEFAMHAALHIKGHDTIVIAGLGTDGTDGPTDAAGAIAYGDTIARAEQMGLDIRDYISNNDSYRFFDATGDLIKTGPTNTNVMDIYLMLLAM